MAKKPDVDSSIVLVTPEMAAQFLENNYKNRALSTRRVGHLADAMNRGEWRYTDESIKVDVRGRLLDGQHRLSAIASSSVSQWMRVTTGLETLAFEVLDRGKRRSPADVLSMHGYTNYTGCASTATWLDRLTCYRGKKATRPPTAVQVVEYMEAFPGIPDMVALVKKYNAHRVMKSLGLPSAMGIMALNGDTCSIPERLRVFFERLGDGVELTRRDPIYVLRHRLDREREHLTVEEKAIGLIKTWNRFLDGKQASSVQVILREDRGEEFPVVKTL